MTHTSGVGDDSRNQRSSKLDNVKDIEYLGSQKVVMLLLRLRFESIVS